MGWLFKRAHFVSVGERGILVNEGRKDARWAICRGIRKR